MHTPCSPLLEIDGLLYFPRMCDKIRLHAAGTLHEDYLANIGLGMDLWCCQFLGIDYSDLVAQVTAGASDEEALAWAKESGTERPAYELDWWTTYMKTRGFRDDLSEKLSQRKAEAGFTDRDDIQSFMDYIIADEA